MTEKTFLKFTVSESTGELISFVSKNSKTGKLRGVAESDAFAKKICVLSETVRPQIVENTLYSVELKEMKKKNGYVVVSATQKLFPAKIESVIISKVIYKVSVQFGNKTIYFDPIDGRSPSSKTLKGVLAVLEERNDIKDKDQVIADFKVQAKALTNRLNADGYLV